MKKKSETAVGISKLESQKIDSTSIKGGTKQTWNNETEKDMNSNNIPEGSAFPFKKKPRGGITPTNSTEPK